MNSLSRLVWAGLFRALFELLTCRTPPGLAGSKLRPLHSLGWPLLKVIPLLLFALLSLQCGSVGEPQSPLLNIPVPPGDFQARQDAEGIHLEWTWPRVTTEGMALNGIARFEVYAFPLAGGSPTPDSSLFEREGRLVTSLEGAALDTHGPGDRLSMTLRPDPWMGRLVSFAVRGETRRRRSDLSNIALVDVTTPPARPALIELTVDPEAIELSWPATDRADRYAVERRVASGDSQEIGVVDAPRFRDAPYTFGVSYSYRVQGIADTSTAGVRGEFSDPVTITPADTFAPSRPLGLRAVATESAVELSWEPGKESDLAGFRVRRREAAQTVVLNSELSATPAYSDGSVLRGAHYTYEVTAVDQQGNESEPSDPVEVTVP